MKQNGIVISAVFPKGGEWKSTFIQTISTSKPFNDFDVAILEADSQGSLSHWLKERTNNNLPDLNIPLFKYSCNQELSEAINRYSYNVDFLFVDLPGESQAASLTRSALAYSDMCVTPMRPSDKAIRAFENNFLNLVKDIWHLRKKNERISPFYLLPTFAHTSTLTKNHREIYQPYSDTFNIMNAIHRDRQLFTYFSQGGMTLSEYSKEVIENQQEHRIVMKGIKEIDAIATEILDTFFT